MTSGTSTGSATHDVVPSLPQGSDNPVDGRPRDGAVVENRERQTVGGLAHDEHLVACLLEQPSRSGRQRLAAELGERLG